VTEFSKQETKVLLLLPSDGNKLNAMEGTVCGDLEKK